MKRRTCRTWLATVCFALLAALSPAAHALMGGIDHLADNLSVTDFWVNGAAGSRAGSGNAGMPSPVLPDEWHPGMKVHVVWDVRDWEHDTGATYEADVPVEPYGEDGGRLWVHFLADGSVRVVRSTMGPRAPNYPGPHDLIPQKEPWDRYPPRIDWRDFNEGLADIAIGKKQCAAAPDPATCADEAWEKLIDEQRVDARRYLPRCAGISTGYLYDECQRQARESMRLARLARRCQAAPERPECVARKTMNDTSNAEKRTGAPDQ